MSPDAAAVIGAEPARRWAGGLARSERRPLSATSRTGAQPAPDWWLILDEAVGELDVEATQAAACGFLSGPKPRIATDALRSAARTVSTG
jgi:hypothetical protein